MNSTPQKTFPAAGAKRVAAQSTRLGRLAGWCYDHRRWVVLLWIVAVVLISSWGSSLGSNYSDKFSGGNSESSKALHLLQDRFPAKAGDTADIVFHSNDNIAEHQSQIQDVLAQVSALGATAHVDSVVSPYSPEGSRQIATQAPGAGHTVYAVVQFDKPTADIPTAAAKKVIDTARSATKNLAPGLQVEFGGSPVYKAEPISLGSAELIGMVAAIFILLIAFGSIVAMGLPLVTALFGIGIGSAAVVLMSHVMTMPSFAPQMALMIGLGVGIDYALFIVTRYRDELHSGREPRDAVVVSMATAGHAVVFAGTTVVISLIGMFLLGVSFIYGLALGSIAVVLMVMGSALTLLPAVLGFVGRTIDKLHVPGLLHKGDSHRETFWFRWSRVVQKRAWITGAISLAILLALAIPLLSMRMGQTDSGSDPSKATTRRAYDLLADGFGAGSNGPLIVAVDIPKGGDASGTALGIYDKLAQAAAAPNSDIATVSPAIPNRAVLAKALLSPDQTAARIIVIPKSSPQAKQTTTLVRHLRDDVVPAAVAGTGATAYVGGITAAGIDGTTGLVRKLPWVIGGVVILSFLLLMAVFRSLAVPLKAAVMNLLSIGAAYGVIVAVFQWGWGASLIGVTRTGPIESWIPLMLFTILFGLSMDYEVFLLSRIREEWLSHGKNDLAVADGLAATARVITAAAAIMVFVFGSFVLGDLQQLKLFGLGLATAVFVDATLVRMVLVPSTMELLGNANWWFPDWLDRIVPRLSVEVDADAPGTRPSADPSSEREPVSID